MANNYLGFICTMDGTQYKGDMCWVLADYSPSGKDLYGAYTSAVTLCSMFQEKVMNNLYRENRIFNCGFEDKCIDTARETCQCGSLVLNEAGGFVEVSSPEPSKRFRIPTSIK